MTIRADEHAITLLRRLLESRRASPFARICEDASPTQHLVDVLHRALCNAPPQIKRDTLRVEALRDDDFDF